MGKPTGFMEYQRKTGNTVAPLERIKNFKEFHLQLPKKEQQMQAARRFAAADGDLRDLGRQTVGRQ